MSGYEKLDTFQQSAVRHAAVQLQRDLMNNGLTTPPEVLFSPEVIRDVSSWIARTGDISEIVKDNKEHLRKALVNTQVQELE